MRVSASGSGVSSSAIGSAEGGHRLVADPTSETASAFRDSNRPGAVAVPNIPVAVSAHDPSQRAAMAPTAPSDARTQGDRDSSAIRSTEDAAARSVRGGDSAVRGRGEWAPFPPSTTPPGKQLAGKSAGRAMPDAADQGTLSCGRAAVKALAAGASRPRPAAALRVTAPRLERSCGSTKTSSSTAMTNDKYVPSAFSGYRRQGVGLWKDRAQIEEQQQGSAVSHEAGRKQLK